MFTLRRIIFIGLIASALLLGVFFVNLWIFIATPAETGVETLSVERGMAPGHVAELLQEKGLISNIPLFKIYLTLRGSASKIRAGEYSFPPRVTPTEILNLLLKGDFATSKITIPEGWTAREIATALENMKLVNGDRFLQMCGDATFIQSLGLSTTSLEGYLFPDTYEIYKPKNEEEVLKKLVSRFQQVYAKEAASRDTALATARPAPPACNGRDCPSPSNPKGEGRDGSQFEARRSQQDVVILASIVEKETAKEAERPLIAGVFLNRLKKGMPLATDPAVIYGIPNFSGNLTRQDLTRPGPYNTYMNIGLPPTPIANPGAEAIRAVLYPTETDYLYFVSKNDGSHYFSRTEEEHNAAVRKYQLSRPR